MKGGSLGLALLLTVYTDELNLFPTCPQRTYIFTFLLSSRLFMHPYELMSKVCHLCMEQQRLADPQADKVGATVASGCGGNIVVGAVVGGAYESTLRFQKRVRKITPKILQLLTEWTETFPYDFRDERMMRSLKELTHRLASGEEVSLAGFLLMAFEAG